MKKYYTDDEMQKIQNMDRNILKQNYNNMSIENQNQFKQTYQNTLNKQKFGVPSDNLEGLQGFDNNTQVGIPGVNMVGQTSINPQIPQNPVVQQNNIQSQVNPPKVNDLYSSNTDDKSMNNYYNKVTGALAKGGEAGLYAKEDFDKTFLNTQDKINDTYDAYTLKRGELYKNKGYYKNFDSVDSIFNNVLNDVRNIQKNTGTIQDTDYQMIANKYGVSVDEIKNPGSIFNKLEYTEDGERKFGITKGNLEIDKITRDYERNKEDLSFQLEGARQNLDNQIEDLQIQLKRNLAWGEASGVWNNSLRSSGYKLGLENMKRDGERVISRLEQAKDRLNQANDRNLKRLTEDYNLSLSEAKKTLDSQIKELKFDSGIALNTAVKKYDIDSDDLTKVLHSIQEDLGIKTMDIFTKYHQNVALINKNTEDKVKFFEKIQEMQDAIANKRYNEYLANNGELMRNTSLNQIIQEVESGAISIQKMNDLKGIMQTSIQATLGKLGVLTQDDVNVIDDFLDKGYTPAQIIAKFQESERFKEKQKLMEVGGAIYNPNTNSWIQAPTQSKYHKLNDDTIFDERTGEFIDINKTIPVGTNYKNENVNGTITQTYGTKSPLGIDNVKLANGEVGTPGVDIAGTYGSNIKSFTQGEVIGVVTGKKRGDKGYGNSVRIRDEDGNIHMYNHLAEVNVKPGDKVSRNTKIGTMGNSGSTLGKNGTHLDYRVSSNGKVGLNEGNWIDPSQFMEGGKDFSMSDIRTFNDLTASEKMKQKNNPEYIEFEKKREEIFSNPNASIDDIMRYSRGGKELTDQAEGKLNKFDSVLEQLGEIQNQIKKMNTGPIIGRLKKFNVWDVDIATLKAQLNSLVPGLARGIYGEVGVLTAADIEHYSKTIPNLTSTNDINNAILSMNLKMLAYGYKSQLRSLAASGRDVSGYRGTYDSLMSKVQELDASLPKVEVNSNKEFDSLYD